MSLGKSPFSVISYFMPKSDGKSYLFESELVNGASHLGEFAGTTQKSSGFNRSFLRTGREISSHFQPVITLLHFTYLNCKVLVIIFL